MTSQHISGTATVTVRRIGRHVATCWVTISDERDTWEVTGTFLDVLLLAERVAAAVLDEAEDFLNSVGAQVIAEVESERRQRDERQRRGFGRLFRRRRD